MQLHKVIESELNLLYIFRTDDNRFIETVFSKERHNCCISSQIGCNVSCDFCASGKNGFIRNLSEKEILFQIDYVIRTHPIVNYIHFAGIGEPLYNIDIINRVLDNFGGKSHYKIQLTTTVPNINNIEKLNKNSISSIVLSIHSLNYIVRKKLIPNSISPTDILNFISSIKNAYSCKFYIGYLLLSGINDSTDDIDYLVSSAQKYDLPIFLMYYNKINFSIEDTINFSTNEERFKYVQNILRNRNIVFSVSSLSRKNPIGGCGTLLVNRNI